MTLMLCERYGIQPNFGISPMMPLDGLFSSWSRTTRAIGGDHIGKLTIDNRSMGELTEYYNTWIGLPVVEYNYGLTTYVGFVWQLDLVKNGVNYRRTLNSQYWHNRVNVLYTDTNSEKASTGWAANTSASGVYGQGLGEMEYIYSVGSATSAAATALRDKSLAEYAYPKSRIVGDVDVSYQRDISSGDGLYITTVGYWATLNWQYYTLDTTDNATDLISELVYNTDYVRYNLSSKHMDANTLSTSVYCADNPQRIGQLIEGIVEQGDGSGNIWHGGVYGDPSFAFSPPSFFYNKAPTTVEYELRDGKLYGVNGVDVMLAHVKPGFYIYDMNSPATSQPSGTSNIWDNPRVSYCDEVEFIYPNRLSLHFPGENRAVDVIQAQIKATYFPSVPEGGNTGYEGLPYQPPNVPDAMPMPEIDPDSIPPMYEGEDGVIFPPTIGEPERGGGYFDEDTGEVNPDVQAPPMEI